MARARIRSIKPEFWSDESVHEVSDSCALFFIGLWNFCDDEGKHRNSPKELSLKMPRFRTRDIPTWIRQLSDRGLVEVSADSDWVAVTNWEHQRIDRPKPPKILKSEIIWINAASSSNDHRRVDDASASGSDRIGSDRIISPQAERLEAKGNLPEGLKTCLSELKKTLDHFAINKDPKWDEVILGRLISARGAEKTKLALIGARYEGKTQTFDPAKNFSVQRLWEKQSIFEKCVNLGAQPHDPKTEAQKDLTPEELASHKRQQQQLHREEERRRKDREIEETASLPSVDVLKTIRTAVGLRSIPRGES